MPSTRSRPHRWALLLVVSVFFSLAASITAHAQEGADTSQAEPGASGWVCGGVLDETHALVTGAQVALYPREAPAAPETGKPEAEPLARATTDPHGVFCLRDLPPGFYQLQVTKDPWPAQPRRTVEVRAGLMNRLTPIEMELEPGEPRVSYKESFDGMPVSRGRALMERLLLRGDAASVEELARRLLPKRGAEIDLAPLVQGLDVKPLLEELLRELEDKPLPALKSARFLYVVGELADNRTHDNVVQFLLRKLRDGRRLPSTPGAVYAGAHRATYVSDVAIRQLARQAGKDFKWKYGLPPLQNRNAIQSANIWWREELYRRSRDKQQRQGR
ncbi:MAG: carboxypeptidase-like regulatory domain-containing protein [Terriglobia bacterium]